MIERTITNAMSFKLALAKLKLSAAKIIHCLFMSISYQIDAQMMARIVPDLFEVGDRRIHV